MSGESEQARLRRLELAAKRGGKGRGKGGGRCEQCRGRPGSVKVYYLAYGPDFEPAPHGDHSCAGPCLKCGWRPEVEEVVHDIVAGGRPEAKRYEDRATAEDWRVM